LKIKTILAAAVITTWSSIACAGFVTTFGQTKNPDTGFPLTFYPEAVNARDNFLGSVAGTPSFYDFESATVGATTLNFGLGGVGVTLSGSGQVKSNKENESDMGRFSVSGVIDPDPSPQGTRYWEVAAPPSGVSSFKLDFDKAVQSFGFFATDVGDFGGLLSLELTLMNDSTVTIQPGGAGVVPGGAPLFNDQANGSVLFFGVSTSLAGEYFKSVRFISQGGVANDIFGFDMFTVIAAPTGPNPTPLPGSLVLVGAALGGLALVRRRR
jgi:hypothetical protein